MQPRSFNPAKDELDEVIGLGEVCSSCLEYVTGSLSDKKLPKPTEGRKKNSNIVKQWKGEAKTSGEQIYGQ
jgi:hypothetical protein